MLRNLAPWKVPFACASITVTAPLILAFYGQMTATKPALAAAPAARASAQASPIEISLADALGRRWITAQCQSEGHEEVLATIVNHYTAPLRLTFAAGLIFETDDFKGQLALASRQMVDVPAAGKREARLAAVSTHLNNPLTSQVYHLCPDTLQSLTALFAEVDRTPEISREAVQTAVLMLTDNAPLDVFAKFALLSPEAAGRAPVTAVYQVNNSEILAAFELLRAAAYPRSSLAATRDPQLEIEAMIDPLSHAAALSYYRISPDQEWVYWRHELQAGDPGTRHYALYGIGRYYPEVALQMLPDWARSRNLSALYRTSALQAMAETRRPEAISMLQTLVGEFGSASELGQSARKAIAYLQNQRTAPSSPTTLVDFRISQADVR